MLIMSVEKLNKFLKEKMKFTEKEIESNKYPHNRDDIGFVIVSYETAKSDTKFGPKSEKAKIGVIFCMKLMRFNSL